MKNEKRDIRLVFLVFSAFFSLFAWKYFPSTRSDALIVLVVIILCLLAFSPFTLRPAFQAWMKLAQVMGKVNTQILLSLMFIVIFIPAGLIKHFFGKDAMKRKMRSDETYWEAYTLEGLRDKSRYKRQF